MQPLYEAMGYEQREQKHVLRSQFEDFLTRLDLLSADERARVLSSFRSLLEVLPSMAGPLPAPPQSIEVDNHHAFRDANSILEERVHTVGADRVREEVFIGGPLPPKRCPKCGVEL
jgi:hypothetical protein